MVTAKIRARVLFFLRVINRRKDIPPKAVEINRGYATDIMCDPDASLSDLLMAASVQRMISIAAGLLPEPEDHQCIACQEVFLAENYRVLHEVVLPEGFHEHKAMIQCPAECRHNPDQYRRPVQQLATSEAEILRSHYRTERGSSW
jgi:hypothetical protein